MRLSEKMEVRDRQPTSGHGDELLQKATSGCLYLVFTPGIIEKGQRAALPFFR